MPEDDTIERVIKRDLDRLPLLPADRWVPSQARRQDLWLRPGSAAGLARTLSLALTVMVVAVAAGFGLAQWRAQHAPSDEPQAAASGVPGPLNLGGGAPNLGFGLVSTSANTLLVRNETTESAPLTFSPALPQVAVSPNGHEIAYWRVLPDRQTGQANYELVRSDVVDPAVRDRLVMRAPSGEAGGAVIWSSDGTGLLANTHTPPTRGDAAGTASRPAHATWFTIEVASGKTERLPQAFADAFTLVYAWDRARDLITGSTISFRSRVVAGGPTFVTFTGGVIQSHPLPRPGLIAAADAYGKSVVIAYAGDCKGVATTARCPVLEVHDQATFATITASPVGEATTDYPDVVFRPRSQDLIVQLPLQGATARVELWSDLGRGSHQVLASYSQSGRFTARRELMLPRIDGSAAFLLKFDDSAGGRWFGELVGLSPVKGATGFERTPFEIRTGGNPLASVVLDPAFARAIDLRSSASPSSGTAAVPTCPLGQSPVLDVDQTPPPGDQPGTGAATPEAAFNRAFPTITSYKMYEFGTTTPYIATTAGEPTSRGPVWIIAEGRTFISLYIGATGQNSWFAHPATFLGCRTPANVGTPTLATATEGSRTGPVSTTEIIARLNAAGLTSRISPPAPSRLLLYNATDLDLVAVDEPAIKGLVVYRYPSVAAAASAFRLEAVQDPARSTVDYIAKPYFVGIGDALVVFATNDVSVAHRVIAALTS